MPQTLQDILETYRNYSQNEREKGFYFEKLIKAFLSKDPQHKHDYQEIWFYGDWAKLHGESAKDRGIDLVAKNADDDKFTAIQCKFYADNAIISRKDIDSFISEATTKTDKSTKSDYFNRLILIDTAHDLGGNADELIAQSDKITRINITDLLHSAIDWSQYEVDQEPVIKEPKTLRPHQKDALDGVKKGFADAERGQLIMACGTGKTFTSLKIAESIVGNGGIVLYLVPSLALINQTIREWAHNSDEDMEINAYATCSDAGVGKPNKNNDYLHMGKSELAYPATTNPQALSREFIHKKDAMNVVYTTYQSLDVIQQAQQDYNLPEFDLIICDEAHRTTGAKTDDKDESSFIKIHSNDNIMGKRRLYMTATPKVYNSEIKEKANKDNACLMAMDNKDFYGDVFYHISFNQAVQQDLLCDYKVIVLAVDENIVSASLQNRLKDENNKLQLDDASKIIGCYKALTKEDIKDKVEYDTQPIKSALAFCNSIPSSKLVTNEFQSVVNEYRAVLGDDNNMLDLDCQLKHVDGKMKSTERARKLDWLANSNDDECRILSNARCLSEGVDVPSLDAIMFMHPRKSQIDIVQAVGRVMRKADNKKLGYVIIPVGFAPDTDPASVLNKDTEKYKQIWQVLNALRSHDEHLDAKINQGGLGQDISDKISIYIASDALPASLQPQPTESSKIGDGFESEPKTQDIKNQQINFVYDDIHKAIMNKLVEKCGTRLFWYDWASDIADIAKTHISLLEKALDENPDLCNQFNKFLTEIRDDLNESITQTQAIEMLAQHLITKPVFDALFENYQFASLNPVSKAMDGVLQQLAQYNFNPETQKLNRFYDDVKKRVDGLENPQAKQNLIIQLYDHFFKKAFPETTEKLGIVYTPIEVVDFIIHSVNDVLKSEFNQSLGSDGVHIIDPFTGTGSFIVRLIESGLLTNDELKQKFTRKDRFGKDFETTEIHANEIILLAYYIASINIEQAYHHAINDGDNNAEYHNFEGICLTDTFALHEKDDLIQRAFQDNSQRRMAQKSLDAIQVIIGNPPYLRGSSNIKYKNIDKSIDESYAFYSVASNKNMLYDSYIRAIRWASDRIGNHGVIGFISGNSFIDSNATDGLRKCFADEFTTLNIFNLRGDINKNISSGGYAKEGGNIFDSGSKTGIAISILVKNKNKAEKGQIYYHDIGDDLKTKQKLDFLTDKKSISNLDWQKIIPNKYHDWINQRDENIYQYIIMGSNDGKKKNSQIKMLFNNFSLGIATGRDKWCYNYLQQKLLNKMQQMIDFYNQECERYQQSDKAIAIKNFVNHDVKKIKWNDSLYNNLKKSKQIRFNQSYINLSR